MDRNRVRNYKSGASEKFQIRWFNPVVDQYAVSLDKRIEKYHELSEKFGFFSKMSTLSTSELKTAAEHLVESYPDDLDVLMSQEIIQFSEFVKIFLDEEPLGMSTELFLFKLIEDKGVKDMFPNVEVALRIYLVMMVSNCSGERSFSKLNLIKDRLRSSMKQERLVHLSLMSIESDILRELNYDDLINTFAASKARKESI